MKSDSIVIENKEKRMFFTNETLRAMIIPLFLEQLLLQNLPQKYLPVLPASQEAVLETMV